MKNKVTNMRTYNKCAHLEEKLAAVATRSYVARKLAAELIDKLQSGTKLEDIGLHAPENGDMDTETWLNYNTLSILKHEYSRTYNWYMEAIEKDDGYDYWGITSPNAMIVNRRKSA